LATVGYPKGGKPVSQATLAKLSTATYTYGKTLRQEGVARAPDGGAVVDYPKGWRFLPSATKEQHEILKKNSRVAEALRNLHNLSSVPSTKQYGRDPNAPFVHQQKTEKNQKIVNNAHYSLVIAPQIKAQEVAIARKEEEERQAIATLKMRVLELEKPIYEPITKITTERSWSKYAILGIGVVIFLIILRRRA